MDVLWRHAQPLTVLGRGEQPRLPRRPATLTTSPCLFNTTTLLWFVIVPFHC
jgi:hypothetical protein